jgi:hypothetical protein
MSYNGSGTFQINTTGQPVVTGTVISATTFNSLTADLATGLSTAITKDGQTTTTARIPFAAGITSTLATDATSTASGSIITAGGVGIAKNLYVGVNANVAGTLSVTGSTTLTNPVINNIKMGYSTTATAAGTTTLTVASNYRQFFTGSTTQTVVLPVTSTLVTGMAFEIENNSTGTLTVNSSGGNLVGTIPAGVCAHAVCIGTTLTTAADWDWDYISTTTITGTGANVLGTAPTIGTPTLGSSSTDTVLITGAPSIGGAGLGMGMGFRNRIINGAMVIDQRNAGASISFPTTAAYYTVDRWYGYNSVASKFTVQQNAGSLSAANRPTGFTNYLGVTSTSAYSVLAADAFIIVQAIEGLNVADLNWGTANAATVTLSFWVRSSLTGTFGGSIQNSGSTRSYPFSYSIPVANTWTAISITIAGDTSGTWLTTNGIGISIVFGMGVGSTGSGTAGAWAGANYSSATGATSVVGTNGATFYITGVQLEKGSTATSFDYRPYGTELALCQRYYWQFQTGASGIYYGSGYCRSAARIDWVVNNPVPMRAAPTLNAVNGTSYFICEFGGSASDNFDAVLLNAANPNTVSMYATSGVSVTSASGCLVLSNNSSAVVGYSSEL